MPRTRTALLVLLCSILYLGAACQGQAPPTHPAPTAPASARVSTRHPAPSVSSAKVEPPPPPRATGDVKKPTAAPPAECASRRAWERKKPFRTGVEIDQKDVILLCTKCPDGMYAIGAHDYCGCYVEGGGGEMVTTAPHPEDQADECGLYPGNNGGYCVYRCK